MEGLLEAVSSELTPIEKSRTQGTRREQLGAPLAAPQHPAQGSTPAPRGAYLSFSPSVAFLDVCFLPLFRVSLRLSSLFLQFPLD